RTAVQRPNQRLSRTSRFLPIRIEERSLYDGRGDPVTFPLDREVDIDARPRPGIRRCDRHDCNVLLEERRPAPARRPANLAVSRIQRDLRAPRSRRRLRRQSHVQIELLNRPPIDHESDRPAGGAAARSRSTQISYPRSPVYLVREIWTGIPANVVFTNRKYFSF